MQISSEIRKWTFGNLSECRVWTESLHFAFRHRFPGSAYLSYLCPQPADFAAADCRIVRRYGRVWKLHPAQYFQWHHYFGFPDSVLDTLLSKARESRVILDVGANIGLYSLLMADVCRGEVHSFEAATGTAAHLRLHCDMNGASNVVVNQVAVSDRAGVAELFDHGHGDTGKASLRKGKSRAAETVQVCTIDAYVTAKQLSDVDLIKVDVEGMDAAVIRGAWETITRCRPAVCLELTPAWMVADDTEVLRRLIGLGYRLRVIGPDGRTSDATLDGILDTGSQRNVLLEPQSA